jgi:hypothetical protein
MQLHERDGTTITNIHRKSMIRIDTKSIKHGEFLDQNTIFYYQLPIALTNLPHNNNNNNNNIPSSFSQHHSSS